MKLPKFPSISPDMSVDEVKAAHPLMRETPWNQFLEILDAGTLITLNKDTQRMDANQIMVTLNDNQQATLFLYHNLQSNLHRANKTKPFPMGIVRDGKSKNLYVTSPGEDPNKIIPEHKIASTLRMYLDECKEPMAGNVLASCQIIHASSDLSLADQMDMLQRLSKWTVKHPGEDERSDVLLAFSRSRALPRPAPKLKTWDPFDL